MPSIGVLEPNQKPTDRPTRRIKRSGGHSLVNQQKADWIIHNVLLQMRDVSSRRANYQPYAKLGVTPINPTPNACRRPYIPAKMPWAELPGVKFVDPISKTATQNQAVKRRFFVMAANRIAAG